MAESIDDACNEISYTERLMCKNQLDVILETIKKKYPTSKLKARQAKVKGGQFKGTPLYQVWREYGPFGKLLGNILLEFDARSPRNIRVYDEDLVELMHDLPAEFKIKNVFYIPK